jgi:RecB family endonuclease NucS
VVTASAARLVLDDHTVARKRPGIGRRSWSSEHTSLVPGWSAPCGTFFWPTVLASAAEAKNESVRLVVARCTVEYTGRLTARLPEALRLLMFKADGSVLVHTDSGGYKPLNWMTPPTCVEQIGDVISVRKLKGDDQLEITLHEVISDSEHEMELEGGLVKDGVEADLQVALAEAPGWCGEGFRLVRREWPTDIGPVDLMCRDCDDGWVAVEIKRIGTIDAVEQLARYLERLRLDPAMADCRGVLAAQIVKPQARVLAESRGIDWVEVDLAVLRGEREPDLQLFAA